MFFSDMGTTVSTISAEQISLCPNDFNTETIDIIVPLNFTYQLQDLLKYRMGLWDYVCVVEINSYF